MNIDKLEALVTENLNLKLFRKYRVKLPISQTSNQDFT